MDFAFLLMARGRLDEAIENLAAVRKGLPHHPAPLVLSAQLFAAQGKTGEAERCLATAFRLRPGWPQAVTLEKHLRRNPAAVP